MTNPDIVLTIACGIAIAVGIVGTVVPFVPGLLLSWGAVLVWAIFADGGATKWVVFGIVTLVALVATLLKYLLPGRQMKREGVPTQTIVAGGLLAIIGFFVVPVVGIVLGFLLGVYVAERLRLNSSRLAWPSALRAFKAVGFSMIIEIFGGMCIFGAWVTGVVLS